MLFYAGLSFEALNKLAKQGMQESWHEEIGFGLLCSRSMYAGNFMSVL